MNYPVLVWALSISLLAGDLVRAQTFSEDISVMVVEIPVQVLRNGHPVRGLTAADFEVLDRGQPQEIVGFEVVDLTRVETEARDQAPAETTAVPAVQKPSRGRQFLLLFNLDFFEFEDQFEMVRALRGARRMVREQLHPQDRAAVGLHTGSSGPQVLIGFTRDRELLEAGLDFVDALLDRDQKRATEILTDLEVGGDSTSDARTTVARLTRQFGSAAGLVISASDLPTASLRGYNELVGSGGGLSPGGEGGSDGLVNELSDMSELATAACEDRIIDRADELGEMATLLRGVPEPKHFVYFSHPFPDCIGARALNRLDRLVSTFRATGWRVEAVDTVGVPDTLAATERSALQDVDPAGTQLIGGFERFAPPPRGVGFEAQILFMLANDTGGQLLENYNDFGQATGDLIERSAVTYLLVIQPTVERESGKYHRLEVRLQEGAGKGRLLHRPGYYEPKPASERSELEKRLDEADMLFGDRHIDELAVSLMAYPVPSSDSKRTVPLLLEIDGSALLERGGEAAQLTIQAYVLNHDRSVHDVLSQRLQLNLERVGAKLAEGPLRFLGAVEVPPGEHRVRVRVRLEPSSKDFLSTVTVAAANAAEGGPIVLPPLLLHPSDFSPLRLQAPAAAEVAGAFRFEDVTVLPDLAPRLRRGEARHVMVTLYQVDGGSPDLTYRVLDGDGEEVAGALEWQHRSDAGGGEIRLIGRLTTEGLKAGDYRLELELQDLDSGQTSVASSGFQVLG